MRQHREDSLEGGQLDALLSYLATLDVAAFDAETRTEFQARIKEIVEIEEIERFPALRVQGGTLPPIHLAEWQDLTDDPGTKDRVESAIAATGQIRMGSRQKAIGTAWLVREDLAVTARHVADNFATADNAGRGRLRTNVDNEPIEVNVDVLDESPLDPPRPIRVVNPLWLQPPQAGEPDLAFLSVEPTHGITPLSLGGAPFEGQRIAVVGYPGPGRGIKPINPEIFRKAFGEVLYVKRVSPGYVIEEALWRHPWEFWTNATLHHGSSGSPVVDLGDGKVTGLHYDGRYGEANWALKAEVIRDRLARLVADGFLPA